VAAPAHSIFQFCEDGSRTTSDINVQYEKLGIDIVPHFLRIVRGRKMSVPS